MAIWELPDTTLEQKRDLNEAEDYLVRHNYSERDVEIMMQCLYMEMRMNNYRDKQD